MEYVYGIKLKGIVKFRHDIGKDRRDAVLARYSLNGIIIIVPVVIIN